MNLPAVPLPDRRILDADVTDQSLSLLIDGELLLRLRLEPGDDVHLYASPDEPLSFDACWATCYWLFTRDPACQRLVWHVSQSPAQALARGLLHTTPAPHEYLCERGMFWQLPQPWLGAGFQPSGYPLQMHISDGKRHPRRPPKPSGEVYRRYDTRLGAWISLRALDIESDLERFNRWQNHPRVLNFWQEGGTLQQHRDYLERLQADPHTLTLIGCFDDEPFAYFEAYWAKEDRIAPFYRADDYDRGIHMLVGEEHHRGPHKVASWLSALVHYLFLDDPRTQQVVSEPRADNARMIGHLHNACFHCEKEFDFPHKRAALMLLGRERFFARCALA